MRAEVAMILVVAKSKQTSGKTSRQIEPALLFVESKSQETEGV